MPRECFRVQLRSRPATEGRRRQLPAVPVGSGSADRRPGSPPESAGHRGWQGVAGRRRPWMGAAEPVMDDAFWRSRHALPASVSCGVRSYEPVMEGLPRFIGHDAFWRSRHALPASVSCGVRSYEPVMAVLLPPPQTRCHAECEATCRTLLLPRRATEGARLGPSKMDRKWGLRSVRPISRIRALFLAPLRRKQ